MSARSEGNAGDRASRSYRVNVCINREPLSAWVLLALDNDVDVGAWGKTFHHARPARRAVLENHLAAKLFELAREAGRERMFSAVRVIQWIGASLGYLIGVDLRCEHMPRSVSHASD